MRVVPAPSLLPEGVSWTEAVLSRIDASTGVVAVVPTFWTSGHVLDLMVIGARCRELGAALVIDGTQSIGAVEFDVRAVQPDFVLCSGYKWLLCPYGVSFLWAAPPYATGAGARGLELHGWDSLTTGRGRATWGLPGGEDVATGVLDMSGSHNARRFDAGELCGNWMTLPGAIAALEQLLEWTPAAVGGGIAPLCDRIADAAEQRGWRPTPAAARAPHMIGIERGAPWPGDLAPRCWERHGVHVSLRGGMLRVAPHLYNSEEDCDRLMDALEQEVGV